MNPDKHTFKSRLWKAVGKVPGILLAVTALLWFGSRTRFRHDNGYNLNAAERVAMELIEAPANVKRLTLDFRQFFGEVTGESSFPAPPTPYQALGSTEASFEGTTKRLLYCAYDAETDALRTRLADLQTGETLKSWTIASEKLVNLHMDWMDSFGQEAYPLMRHWRSMLKRMSRLSFRHSLPLSNGNLLVTFDAGPLLCIDSAGTIKWRIQTATHHSIERGPDGTYWTGALDPKAGQQTRASDAIMQFDEQGNVLKMLSLPEIFAANPRFDLRHVNPGLVEPFNDPWHLNDVQPAFQDSKKGYWKKGDLFMSLRNCNTILLYRPSENRILWAKSTGWTQQHDVNIVNDSTITVFDNNRPYPFEDYQKQLGDRRNRLVFYDFTTDSTYTPFQELFDKYSIATPTQGRGRWFPQDSLLFVESTDQARIFLKDYKTGEERQLVIPSGTDGYASYTEWSRLLD